jgi:hypothetical protein
MTDIARRRARSADGGRFDMQRLDWFDLRNMLTVARAVARPRSRAPRAAAPTSARTIPACCRDGG